MIFLKVSRCYKLKIKNILFILIGISLILIGLNKNMNNSYSLIAKKESNYQVYLKPNQFYPTNTLTDGTYYYYLSKAIDKYQINFKYQLKTTKKISQFKYNITGTLNGIVKDGSMEKEIWKKDFIFQKNTYSSSNQIDDDINIDYDYYNNLSYAFQNNYGIKIDSILTITVNVNYYLDKELVKDYIKLDIPINDTVTEVKEDYDKTTVRKVSNNPYGYYLMGIVFILISLLDNKKTVTKKITIKQFKKTLKNYDDLIVNVDNEPDLTNLKIMNLKNIEDLIDIACQNQTSIIIYEVIKDKQYNLYVILNNYVYIKMLTF